VENQKRNQSKEESIKRGKSRGKSKVENQKRKIKRGIQLTKFSCVFPSEDQGHIPSTSPTFWDFIDMISTNTNTTSPSP